jgi:serine/threonine-protein kinase
MQPDNQLPILTTSRYRIDRKLGEGGGGAVFRAWDSNLQKAIVIKTLFNATGSEQERDALKNVKSEYLPQVYDFLNEDGKSYTVMEFIEGQSLDKLLEQGKRFSQKQVIKWYWQISSALAVLHKQNVCHRDIKPANIMLLPNDDVCLIDFNAALVAGNDVQLISRSLGYCSPEQYEIYERYKHGEFSRTSAPFRYDSSSVHIEDADVRKTTDTQATEVIDTQTTELVDLNTQATEVLHSVDNTAIDWKLSDIYSLGATMYHLLSGIRPPKEPTQLTPVSKVGHFSEGIVYIIEQSMRLAPSERFASVSVLSDVLRNIQKLDTRWKVSQSKKIAAAIILPLAFVLFAGTALFGRSVMAGEKEERYYAAIYNIENGSTPQSSYDEALEMFWDRIDPYRAMAERLWNDGDGEACRKYIEANLGNIAKFQTESDAARSFGDIYYILGNCYYYQSEEPDYFTAMGNFAIAVQFVKDNPIYYRDYAISLARSDEVSEAERILEKAKEFMLEEDSLNLLSGEIRFAKKEYDDALDAFARVIESTSDDYLRYRAYHTSDEIYKILGQPQQAAALLTDALNQIPLSRIPEMTERLADAYVKSGNYQEAIVIYEQLTQTGVPQFHIMQNLAILLQNIDDFERSAAVLNQMTDLFPNDYRVPMRKAYLEADKQSNIVNENRNYTITKQYYDDAVLLYQSSLKPGDTDPQMQQLEVLIEQLRANNWIE